VSFVGMALFLVLYTLVIYCPIAHMTWHPDGLMRKDGIIDFAGGTVVHLSSGCAALAASIALGPRRDFRRVDMRPCNLPMVFIGAGLLWFGWLGFNAGSALAANGVAANALFTTNAASASGMVMWILLDYVVVGKATPVGVCVGLIAGLVGVTPAAGYVSVGASLFIGAMTALACYTATKLLQRQRRVDDALETFAW
jgi:Amt family ammonium transporter